MLDTILDFSGRLLTTSFIKRPVFVIGAGRAGTSILQRALSQHSQIVSADSESPFIPYIGFLVHPFVYRENKAYHLESLATSLMYMYDVFVRICFESAFGEHYGLRYLVGGQKFALYKLPRIRYWCAKTFPNKQEALGLIELFPEVRFIHIIRNGCEVVNSRMRKRGMRDLGFEENCAEWARQVSKYDYLAAIEQSILIRHENLVSSPDEVFRTIQSFIGVDYDDGPKIYASSTLVHPLDKRTQPEVNVGDLLTARPPAYQNWTADQKAVFKDVCSEAMQITGYSIPF